MKRARLLDLKRKHAFDIGQRAELKLAIEAQERRATELGIAPDDQIGRRKMDAPAGIKKVYTAHKPHTGNKELDKARRRLERERAKL